ncbi:metal-dependent phosphohydrolase [Nonomuraea sp. NPDC050328]|uniref:metal-dependent phosphohydrolase n=1 Tax=Nonomuraea sp. NPDC050328 TaxID=3364361 RepID=UPI00379401F4
MWSELTADTPAARAVEAELLARWAEPHRRYHDRAHLRAVLEALDELGATREVRLAAWFHDAVYEGRPGWDEERSAQLAQALLPRCGLGPESVAEVARLVRLTAAHDQVRPGDRNGEALCDADLAILASPAYDAYASAIRQEYAHVPDEAFRQGRAAVLRRLLAVPRLYRTETGHERWERAARANMTAELTRLGEACAGAGPRPPDGAAAPAS